MGSVGNNAICDVVFEGERQFDFDRRLMTLFACLLGLVETDLLHFRNLELLRLFAETDLVEGLQVEGRLLLIDRALVVVELLFPLGVNQLHRVAIVVRDQLEFVLSSHHVALVSRQLVRRGAIVLVGRQPDVLYLRLHLVPNSFVHALN
jgi:hypothetical protein